MAIWNRIFDFFCDHAAIVNQNKSDLKREVQVVQSRCGPWTRVHGYADYRQLFLDLHIAKAKRHPFILACIQKNEPAAEEIIVKRQELAVWTYKYSDAASLAAMLPAMR
jgi:hypothetical protein